MTAVALSYEVKPDPVAWEIAEGLVVPESVLHDAVVRYLHAVLLAWATRSGADALIARNFAIRFMKDRPKVGVDPDLCVITPRPPDAERLRSLKLWEAAPSVPRLAIEVVSEGHPYKDYATVQDKFAACGCEELWVLDPELAGPRSLGGPVKVQVWRRVASGAFERIYAGEGPVQSGVLSAWLHLDQETHYALTDDRTGERRWLTGEETERAEREAERAQKEAAFREVARLRAELSRRGGA